MLSLVGVFYPYNRGALFTALVVIYALTSGIAGYTASSFYCQLEGKNWVSTKHQTLALKVTVLSTAIKHPHLIFSGEKLVTHWRSLLWPIIPHLLLPKHRRNRLQCNRSSSLRNHRCYRPYMDTSDFAFTCIGWHRR